MSTNWSSSLVRDGCKKETEEAHEGSSPCMAASSTYRLPPTGCTIAIASTFFAPPPTYLSSTRILHLQGGVTLKTLPVLNYSVPLSFSLSSSSANFFTSITVPLLVPAFLSLGTLLFFSFLFSLRFSPFFPPFNSFVPFKVRRSWQTLFVRDLLKERVNYDRKSLLDRQNHRRVNYFRTFRRI